MNVCMFLNSQQGHMIFLQKSKMLSLIFSNVLLQSQ